MNAAATPPPTTSATVRPADRLGFTLFLAAALHVALILGIGFGLFFVDNLFEVLHQANDVAHSENA